MAPNLAVKSDSWLDLSINVPVAQPAAAANKKSKELARFTSSPTNHRHSISSFYPTIQTQISKSSTLNSDSNNTADYYHSYLQNRYFNELLMSTNSNQQQQQQLKSDFSPLKSDANGMLGKTGCCVSRSNQIINQHNNSSSNNGNREHLLIRMRQQSYLNRSSSTTLSSNLSNSIELAIGEPPAHHVVDANKPSLAANSSPSQHECGNGIGGGGHDDDDDVDAHDDKGHLLPGRGIKQQQHSLGGRRESRRLAYMRERLSGGARGSVGVVAGKPAGQAIKATSGRQASPLARSLSSLSGRLAGKLTHFRHSCKNFLHNYNNINTSTDHNISATRWRDCEHHGHPQASACAAINLRAASVDHMRLGRPAEQLCPESRNRMTGDWVERHHQHSHGRLSSVDDDATRTKLLERPRSLEVSSLLYLQRQQATRLEIDKNDSILIGGTKANNNNNNNNNYKSRIRKLLAPAKTKLSQSSSSSSSPSTTTTGSSTTLVSQPQTGSLESISSASTINSSSIHMSRPAGVAACKHPGQQANPKPNANEDKLAAAGACQAALAPTSDYWSTVNSGSDYYCRQLQHQQQVPSPLPLGGGCGSQLVQIQHEPTPLLASDQEYYLDVANAAAQMQQQPPAATANLQAPTAQHLHHHHHQQSISPQNVSTFAQQQQQQAHLNQLQQQFQLQQQQQQLFNRMQLQPQQQLNDDFLDEDYEDYAVPSDESCRLDRSQVELVQMIGEGQKGYVFLGKLQSKDGRHITDVAIKTLKYETELLIEKLMREAAMMRQFEHPHIIKFIGVCPDTPALIAMELAEFGEVKQYLKLNKHLISISQLVLFTFQISTALSYLESKQYVHRDVAARNVLVCSHNCVKLADFGLSRNLQLLQPANNDLQHQSNFILNPNTNATTNNQTITQHQPTWTALDPRAPVPQLLIDPTDKSPYVAASKGKLPVRWLAPESLAFRRFTSASDVWMFAVCSWEFFQYGQVRPWAHIRNNQVLLAIESGQRLARPPNCPARLYQMMLQCWSYAPIQRPKFRELKQSLWSIYLNERAKEQLELERQQQQQLHLQQLQHQQLQLQLQLQQQQIMPQKVIDTNHNRFQPQQQQQQERSSPMRDNRNAMGHINNLQQWQLLNPPIATNKSAAPKRNTNANSQNSSSNGNGNGGHQQVERHHSTSPMMTNYSSNLSGYSSNNTTTTNERSINSSRSSSMGSLARQQAVAVAAAAAAAAATATAATPATGSASTVWSSRNKQSPCGTELLAGGVQSRAVGSGPSSTKLTSAPGGAERSKIDQNIKRFQRTPGHMLQKQRSQGSIVVAKAPGNIMGWNGASKQYGFDDLNISNRRHRRPISELHLASGGGANGDADGEDCDDDVGDDETDDEDSSDPETTRSPLSYKSHLGRDKMAARPASQMESTYDGVTGEVAMLRGPSTHTELCRKHHSPMAQPTGGSGGEPLSHHGVESHQARDQFTRTNISVSANNKLKEKEKQEEEEEAKRVHEQKLANIIEALKIAPMKAKLTYRASPEEAASGVGKLGLKQQAMMEKPEESGGFSAKATLSESATAAAAKDEQRQLALHRRLLGHIRPASTSSKSLRRQSAKPVDSCENKSTMQQQQLASPQESVDQSLQILESLICEKPRTFATTHEKQVRAAQTSVGQIAEFQRMRRQQQSERPKSLAAKSTFFSRGHNE